MAKKGNRKSAIERLLSRIIIDDHNCWLWQGYKNRLGYGQITVYVDDLRANKRVASTHRVTYQHFVGPIPQGLVIDHLYRVRHCCNPQHMEVVTQKINIYRGVAPSAINAGKLYCLRGHFYDKENTYTMPGGGRYCRTCARIKDAARRPRIKT